MVYLLHFSEKVADHAQHYIGFSDIGIERRLARHLNGDGSRLVRAAVQQGIKVTVARLWPNGDRKFERLLKNRKKARCLCPLCNPKLIEKTPSEAVQC